MQQLVKIVCLAILGLILPLVWTIVGITYIFNIYCLF